MFAIKNKSRSIATSFKQSGEEQSGEEPAIDLLLELLTRERLRYIVVHITLQASLVVLGHTKCRHSNNGHAWQALCEFVASNQRRGFIAITDRHLE